MICIRFLTENYFITNSTHNIIGTYKIISFDDYFRKLDTMLQLTAVRQRNYYSHAMIFSKLLVFLTTKIIRQKTYYTHSVEQCILL